MDLKSPKFKSFGKLFSQISIAFLLTVGGLQSSGCTEQGSSLAWKHAMANGDVLTDRDVKTLRKEFAKKLKSELSSLTSLQKNNRAQAKRERKQSFKVWNQEEKRARHAFFEANAKGAERREYIRGFIERRDRILAKNLEEQNELKEQQEKDLNSLKKGQDERLKSLEDHLARRQRPPEELWGTN